MVEYSKLTEIKMNEFYLNIFLKIFGISAASGIEYTENRIYLISDNSNYLYEYQIANDTLSKHVLMQKSPMEQIKKSEKMDLEAIHIKGDTVFVLGSGSTPIRELGFSVSKKDRQINTIQLSNLYQNMRKNANIDPSDFNIEGITQYRNNWLFLNRGNGPGGRNVIFDVIGDSLTDDFQISSYEINLPQINGLSFGFSGATVIGNSLCFIATAEEGKSTYEDGKVGGTLFGIINLNTKEIQFNQIISQSQKFEGISLYDLQNDTASFLLCEDDDGTTDTSSIFKLDIAYSFTD